MRLGGCEVKWGRVAAGKVPPTQRGATFQPCFPLRKAKNLALDLMLSYDKTDTQGVTPLSGANGE